MQAPACPYCQNQAVLCDASAVYGPTYEGRFNLWVCPSWPDCDSYVGVTRGPDPHPTGSLANGELRKLRRKLHEYVVAELAKIPRRTRGALRIAAERHRANLDATRSRIGFMDDLQCRRALMASLPEAEDRQQVL